MVWMRAPKPGYRPKLRAFIRVHIPNIRLHSPKVWLAFRDWCEKGGKRHPAIAISLVHGTSPQVVVVQTENREGFFDPETPQFIFLDQSLADRFEKHHNDARVKQLVEATILHEMVHWADWTADRRRLDVEAGIAFEQDAYGKVVRRHW